MGSAAAHAVAGAAMMGFAGTADVPDAPPAKADSDILETLTSYRELSQALSREFFSSTGFAVDMSSNKFLQMGAPSLTLLGHEELCKRLPDTCMRTTNSYTPLRVDTAFMEKLRGENSLINNMIAPADDKDTYGQEDYWNFPDNGKGDCEDYVLAKMKRFHEGFGIPLNNMSIVYVQTTPDQPDVGAHAILALRTSDGDYLFDNLTDTVTFPYGTAYKFMSATSFENFKEWQDVGQTKYSLLADKGGRVRNVIGDESSLAGLDISGAPTPLNVPIPSFKPKL